MIATVGLSVDYTAAGLTGTFVAATTCLSSMFRAHDGKTC